MVERPSAASCFGAVNFLQEKAYACGQVCKIKTSALRLQAYPLTDWTVTEKLSKICHPNIVQYLGVSHNEATSQPVLLMELMDDSLTHFLELSEARLPYHLQVNINYDIAQALAFLHTNRIMHRDLSSNNVLLIGAGVRAKIILYMSDKNLSYMSPEALQNPPVYTEKLDCFQAGVLMVQIITRKPPDPGPSTNRVMDVQRKTWIPSPVPETERRDNHLCLVKTHPMYSLAVDCLKDTYADRPSAQQICHRLSALKETPQYRESLEAGEGGERVGDIQEKDQLIQQLQREKDALIQQTLERQHQVEDLQREKEGLLQEKEQLLNEKETLIQKFKEENDLLQKKYKEGLHTQQRKR